MKPMNRAFAEAPIVDVFQIEEAAFLLNATGHFKYPKAEDLFPIDPRLSLLMNL